MTQEQTKPVILVGKVKYIYELFVIYVCILHYHLSTVPLDILYVILKGRWKGGGGRFIATNNEVITCILMTNGKTEIIFK